MAATRPNPLDLTTATRLPPSHTRNFSRSSSPARSPARKAQFAARELDPLLKNLSPDSTLEALQKTNTIGSNPAEQNALAQSISDASESERELGIRAAIAAKNLKEWTQEVNAWTWPSSSDRAWGAGFVPKQNGGGESVTYWGSLPDYVVQEYRDRIDEIWDAMDTLGMDKVKEYVFSSHHPTSSASETTIVTKPTTSGYGRMRDFTALITATVVQSLPVQDNLSILLDTWSIRLTVLRHIPDLLVQLQQVGQGTAAINEYIRDEKKSRNMTSQEFEQVKAIFENKVSKLGKRVDRILDILEGQEDSLPQAWIDSVDDIEGKFADWVARAEQIVLRNQMRRNESPITGSPTIATILKRAEPGSISAAGVHPNTSVPQRTDTNTTVLPTTNPTSSMPMVTNIKRKPVHDANLKAEQGHRRETSEVSVASNFSGYSLENAEIVDARKTTMLPSPHISVVDNPIPPRKDVLLSPEKDNSGIPQTQSGFSQPQTTSSNSAIPKEVVLQRTVSNPSKGIHLCEYHRKSSLPRVPTLADSWSHNQAGDLALNPQRSRSVLPPLAVSPSPSLRVDPLNLRGRELAVQELDSRPSVPRRSSKRLSTPNGTTVDDMLASPVSPEDGIESPVKGHDQPTTTNVPELQREKTFDDKLKSILASMPTKIKLTDTSDSDSTSGSNSESSTRASSPMQTLKLSPVKDTKAGRNVNTSGIHVYHLSRAGKSRDAPPIKLFVRAVGEHGERLMVRVGGGWADLAEYLREYSLHHGGRGMVERKLEVANYPGQHQHRRHNTLTFNPVVSVREIDDPNNSETSSTIDQFFDFGLPYNHPKTSLGHENTSVPGTSSNSNPVTSTGVIPTLNLPKSHPRSPSPAFCASPQPIEEAEPPRTIPTMSTTISPVPYANRYTPLGAAGPVPSARRAVSYTLNRTQSQPNQEWVEGMVNQARAVSGSQTRPSPGSHTSTTVTAPTYATRIIGNVQIVEQPTITTTTTLSSSRRSPAAARPGSTPRTISNSSTYQSFQSNNSTPIASTVGTARPSATTSPTGSQLSNVTASTGSDASYATANTGTYKSPPNASKNRTSFGDVNGIRRVFLRNKTDRE